MEINSGLAQASSSVNHFSTVQLLRFIAAFMVLLTHATFYLSSRIDPHIAVWNVGTQGVSIFFVVSGFVMTLTSIPLMQKREGYKTFLIARIIRVVPLYWALNFVKILQISIIPSIAFVNPDIGNIILSLLFIPSRNAEGVIETFYGVGWTLNFEMFFYMVFVLAIFFRARVVRFVGIALIASAFLSLVRDDSWPAFTYWFNLQVLNFLWGVLIAHALVKNLRLNTVISVSLVLVGFLIIFVFPMSLLGFQYAMVVGGMVFLEKKIGHFIPRVFTFGGDASYSLYLVHPMVGVFIAILLSKLEINSVIVGMGAIIIASLLLATLTYKYFEYPITTYLRHRFLPKKISRKVLKEF
jgi:peptidoglycan/LPS O-acetylase OafA/YrhL